MSLRSPEEQTMPTRKDAFPTTDWGLLKNLRGNSPALREAGLNLLAGRYWRPVYGFLRRSGHDDAEAKDLTQAFFAAWLENDGFAKADQDKGRLRSLMLTSLKRFVSNERRSDNAQRRKPAAGLVSLDALMENYKPGQPPKVFPMEKLKENLLVNAAAPAAWSTVFAYMHDRYRVDNGLGNWVDKGGTEQGVVVFVGSVSAEAGVVGQLGYGMAKNALLGAFRVFKNECYLRLGLRPVLINPGFIETPMVTQMRQEEQEAVLRNVPSHSFITVPAIVETFIYAIKCDSISAPVSVGAGYTCPPRLYRR